MKQIYLFNIVARNYRQKIGFPVCKKKNFAGLQVHRKSGKSARASPSPQHSSPRKCFLDFYSWSPLSWVSKSFRQDIGQISTLNVFYY